MDAVYQGFLDFSEKYDIMYHDVKQKEDEIALWTLATVALTLTVTILFYSHIYVRHDLYKSNLYRMCLCYFLEENVLYTERETI